MVGNEKSQCLSSRGLPEESETHPDIIPSDIIEVVMSISNMGAFFLGHPVSISFHKSPRGPGLRTATAAGLPGPRPGSLANGFGDPAISRGRARAASVTKMSSTCPDMLPDRVGLENTCEKTMPQMIKKKEYLILFKILFI